MMRSLAVVSILISLSAVSGFVPIHHHADGPRISRQMAMEEEAPPMMPPLNNEEIQQILDQIPIYSLVSKETGALFLVDDDPDGKQPDSKAIANFYLSSDFCRALLEGNEEELEMETSGLGEVYFDYYYDNDDDPTEYRLIPDAREVQQARTLLQQMAGIPDAFSSTPLNGGYLEIPIFMDQHLRLAEGDEPNYREIFPMYLGWNDLVTTCQEYVDAGMDEEYAAAISIVELHQLIADMRKDSPIDFRNVQFVPATPRPLVEETQ